MGDPKKLRKKYNTPSKVWSSERIAREHDLRNKYGLRKLKEVWLSESELRRIRKNVRSVLAGLKSDETGKQIIDRLARYNIVKPDSTLDDLLILGVDALLERRLQTIVFRKGLAHSLKQSRQLITHGFITVRNRRITSPSYVVRADESEEIRYYKPINLETSVAAPAAGAATAVDESKIKVE